LNRLKIYSAIYLIILIIYLLFNNIAGIEVLVFIVFLLSSIILVFAREELPKPKLMKIIEAREYQEKRINIFGYSMSAMLILASILFTSLTLYFKLNIAISSLIIWPIIDLMMIISTNYLSKKAFKDNLVRYISEEMDIDKNKLNNLADYLIKELDKTESIKNLEDKFIAEYKDSMSILSLREIYSKFEYYLSTQSQIPTSDEISEANKRN